ncbi:MAG: hypothetical protein ABIW82_09540 [Dokdonella sp.]
MSKTPGRWLNALSMRRLTALVEPRIIGPGGLHSKPVKQVLIVALGDDPRPALCATPLIQEFQFRFPGVEIDVLVTSRRVAMVFDGFESVRRVIAIPAEDHGLIAWFCALTRLFFARYDLGFDLGESHELGRAILAIATPRALLFVPSPDNSRWAFVMFFAPRDSARLPVFMLRRALVCEEQRDEIGYPPIALRLTGRERRHGAGVVRRLLRNAGTETRCQAIGLLTNHESQRSLTHAWWKRFVREFERLQPDSLFIEITALGGSRLCDSIAHYASSDFRQVVAVFRNLSVLVVADPNVAHLASAGGTATVALHSIDDSFGYLACGPHCRGITVDTQTPESAARTAARALVASGTGVALRTLHPPEPETRPPVRRSTTTSSKSYSEPLAARNPRMIGAGSMRQLLAGTPTAEFPIAVHEYPQATKGYPSQTVRNTAPVPIRRTPRICDLPGRLEKTNGARTVGKP